MKYKISDVWLKLILRVNPGFLNLLGLMPYLEGVYQICLILIYTAYNAIYICKAFRQHLHLCQKSLQTVMWRAFLHFHRSGNEALFICSFLFSFCCVHYHIYRTSVLGTHFSGWRGKVVTVLRCVVLFLTDSFVSSDSQGCYNSVSDDVDLLLVFWLTCHLEEKTLA